MVSPRFSFDLASVVFGDHGAQQSIPTQDAVVSRFRSWLDGADRSHAHAASGIIDSKLIPSLTPPGMLEVARLIEARFPEVIMNMPNLSRHRDHLTKAHQLAQVFMGANLTALVQALREEGVR